MSSLGKDLIAVLKSRGTILTCGILISVITGRYLGPEGNGILATLIVYPNMFMTVGSLGIRQSTAFFVGQKKFEDSDIFASVLQVWVFTSILCVIICFILLKYVTKGNYSNYFIFLAVLPLPFSLITTYASGLFLGKNRIKDFNSVNWIPNVVRLVSYVIFIILIRWDLFGALIGIIIGYVALTYFVWTKVKDMVKLKWKANFEITKKMLSLGVVYALSLMVINLNYKLDVALLERFSTEYQVGIYTKGVSIVEYLWEIPTVLSTIIFARSATAEDGKAFSYKVCQLLRICFIVITLMSIAFYFFSEFIMVTMYGEQFRASATSQRLLLPGILLLTVFKVLNFDLAGKGKPWIASISMVPALILNVLFNWLWDAKYGANGAALASTVSYSFSAIVFLAMYSRFIKIPVKDIVKFSRSDFDFLKFYLQKFRLKSQKA